MFGYQIRHSTGWEDDGLIGQKNKFRIGFSYYDTSTKSNDGIFYGFLDIATNVLGEEIFTSTFGGGISIGEYLGIEIQFNDNGAGGKFFIMGWEVASGTYISGTTYFSIGKTKDLGNGKSRTKGFVAEADTEWLINVAISIYLYYQYGVSVSPDGAALPAIYGGM